mmetsp:Transcript_18080/g.33015  ORF Transcript_18080/g.33015 Transcript_18080/m.33015 type:complete len:264 (-) Transcript_18080:732-1523(-)
MQKLVRLDKEGVEGLAEGVDDEADFAKLGVVENVASVEDEGRFGHLLKQLLVVVRFELVPLRHHADGMCVFGSVVGVPLSTQITEGTSLGFAEVGIIPGELGRAHIAVDLVGGDLGVIDTAMRSIIHEAFAHVDGGGFARVSRVLLEGEAIDGELLPRDRVEHGRDDALNEALLLVVVDVDDLIPVVGDVLQTKRFAHVAEVQDVLLETGSTESDGRVEEFRSNTAVRADGARNLLDVRTGSLAERGDGVHGANALGQKSVGS